jgi:hypothetical protein
MYRYVWAEILAQGSVISLPSNDPELAFADKGIYPSINRKGRDSYPPAWKGFLPPLALWLKYSLVPDVMAAGSLAGILLAGLLHDLNVRRGALIYYGHPCWRLKPLIRSYRWLCSLLVGALWAEYEHDGLTGFLLGIATAMKFYPALLLPFYGVPAFAGWWRMVGFVITVFLSSLYHRQRTTSHWFPT